MTEERSAPSGTDGDRSSPSAGDTAGADLQNSLDDLARLVSGSLGLQGVLTSVATFAVRAIPGADGAGVTLLRAPPSDRAGTDGRPEGATRQTGHAAHPDHKIEALAASAPFVAEIDRLQYETLGEGPCITAVLERRTVRSGSLGGEKLWPRFGPRVGRYGFHSALSLPLALPESTGPGTGIVGAINVYARAKDVFDGRAAELGELFAAPAAVAVHNAQVLSAAQDLAGQLRQALTTRPAIDQAIGVLRARSGMSEAEALARLREVSQREHSKLADVATDIVREAAGRARARHTEL